MMRYSYTGKNLTVGDKLKEKTEQKLNKLSRVLPEGTEVFVTFSVTKNDNRVEVTIPLHKRVLRAEVTSGSMDDSLDQVIDALDKQVVKYKTRLKHKSRRDGAYRDELTMTFINPEEEFSETNEIIIEKNKRFELRPMDAEDAVMEMELLDHSFFVFRDAHSDSISVVYKRKNGTYGLIESND